MRCLGILSVLMLAACSSSSNKATNTSTTTTESTTTSTSIAATTTSTAPAAPTSSSVPVSRFTIVKFTGPPSPVECNAATTMVELTWVIRGAAKTELSIDNRPFAQFPSGTHTGLEPLTCDGKAHVYPVKGTAVNPAATVATSLTLKSKPPA